MSNENTAYVEEHSPSPAARAKRFLAFHQVGILSTHSKAVPGFPFGSIVPYDLNSPGMPIISISTLSEHYKNLVANPQASIFVADQHSYHDPLPFSRITVLGTFHRVADNLLPEVRQSYISRFPKSPARELSHDFCFFSCTPERIRWIEGFGEIRWIDKESFAQANFDPICYHGTDIVNHMNRDHADALTQYLQYYGRISAAERVSLAFVTQQTYTLSVIEKDSQRRIELPFPRPVNTLSEAREVFIEMLEHCRKALS